MHTKAVQLRKANPISPDFGIRVGAAFDGSGSPYDWTTQDTVSTYGAANDLWGTTWTAADINDPSFGVSVSAQHDTSGLATDARIDNITITVSYTPDTTAPTLAEVAPIPLLTNDSTPDYAFTSDEAGTLSYGGRCIGPVAAVS
jgi:hypothetical protein